MEKRLFCRLISRVTLVPPLVALVPTSSWPPPPPTVKRLLDPLTLAQITQEENDCSVVENESKEKQEEEQINSEHNCWLGGSLLGSLPGKEGKIAVGLTRTHLALLLDAVEQGLYEESALVDVSPLRGFIQSALKVDEVTSVPKYIGEAFPELYDPDGERLSTTQQQKKKPDARRSAKPKRLTSKLADKKRKIEDDLGFSTDWETEIEKTSLTWSGQRRSQRRKTRLERQRDLEVGLENGLDGLTSEEKDDDEALEGIWSSSEEHLTKQKTTIVYTDEDLVSLPKDSLQLLLDRLIDEVEFLHDGALRLWKPC